MKPMPSTQCANSLIYLTKAFLYLKVSLLTLVNRHASMQACNTWYCDCRSTADFIRDICSQRARQAYRQSITAQSFAAIKIWSTFISKPSEFSVVAGLMAEVFFKLFLSKRQCYWSNKAEYQVYWLMNFLLINGNGVCNM